MGTISVSLPSDGTSADVSDYNTPLNTIVNEFNGNIDNANIKSAAAISGSKLADASVTSEKLDATVAFYATTTQSIASSAAASDITTYTEVFDYGSDFNHTTGIFTAPYAGVYYFSATASYVDPTNATSRNGIAIVVNSTAISGQSTHLPATNHDPMVNCTAIYALAANDTVKVTFYQDSGGTEALVSPSHFSGYLVGRTD